jgi:3-hydroxyacyl-CoA dehydrogenase
LEKAIADPNVKAIVIICDGRTFIAGADIKEFGSKLAFKLPLTKFMADVENSPKPVIAAVHGTALGGGFEVTLACHYRIGTSRCKVGLPEVLIGILPGAGGTQRLPRLIGPLLAAEMICSGVHVPAATAYERGIFDRIIEIESNHGLDMERLILRQAAVRFALEIADQPVAGRVISRRPCPKTDDFFFDMIAAQSAKKARGFLAPQLCLEAVKAAQNSATFEEGIKEERRLFIQLATGPQARALQSIFFAQRLIGKIPGVDASLAKKINSVGIIGCGTMGGGILMNFVQSGIPVVVLEVEQKYLDKGLAVLKGNWMRGVKKGRMSQKTLDKYMSMITPTTNYEDLSDVDIVIEAVFENLGIKQKVFKELDRVCKPDCILASNTSFLDIRNIASATSRPHQVIGTHFFAPANKMQLLENVRHEGNDAATIATVQSLGKLIKKKAVLVKTCPGFVGNRMYAVMGMEAARLLLAGGLPQEIDQVLLEFGMAMGIFAVGDLSGLDIGYRSRNDAKSGKQLSKSVQGKNYMYGVSDRLNEMGRIGLKVGKGYYDYPDMKTRKPVVSELVNQIVIEESRKLGIERRSISKTEIIERCLYGMINEGTKILQEGIAIRPSDIDVVWVFGYGFPAYRGGLMQYADEVGIRKIRDRLLELSKDSPSAPYFQPTELLNQVADQNTKLKSFWRKRQKANKAKL